MEEKKFVNFKKEEYGVNEFIKKEIGKGRIISIKMEYTPIGEKEKWLSLPSSLKESSAKSAEFISVRKHQLPRKIVEIKFGEFMKEND